MDKKRAESKGEGGEPTRNRIETRPRLGNRGRGFFTTEQNMLNEKIIK